MYRLDAGAYDYRELNRLIRESEDNQIVIDNCLGQRYIGDGLSDTAITVNGTPGNALGAYLNGAVIEVFGNAQDAAGDTMNDGEIIIHGLSGDATGYAMRGGRIFVEGNAGYRAGIHMKAYKEKLPVLVIGGTAGSFLGEYQAGGIIIVLQKDGCDSFRSNFCSTGMHGGKLYVRTDTPPEDLPRNIKVDRADEESLGCIAPYIDEYCSHFGADKNELMSHGFYILTPDTANPYKQLYTYN